MVAVIEDTIIVFFVFLERAFPIWLITLSMMTEIVLRFKHAVTVATHL